MNPATVLSTIIGTILLILLVILARTRIKRLGDRGERIVSRILNKYLKTHKGYLINDVIIANLKGKTSQIDHILFTSYGIFVIETKNYSGRIYGSIKDEYWTQVLNYRTKNRLFNPIIQNRTHCIRIGGILNQRFSIISCVVLVQNNSSYLKGCDNYVHNRNDLLNYLNRYQREVFNDSQLLDMYNKINEYKINPICSKKEHVDRIRRDN